LTGRCFFNAERPSLGRGGLFLMAEQPGVSGDGVAAQPAPKRYGRFKQTQLVFGICEYAPSLISIKFLRGRINLAARLVLCRQSLTLLFARVPFPRLGENAMSHTEWMPALIGIGIGLAGIVGLFFLGIALASAFSSP